MRKRAKKNLFQSPYVAVNSQQEVEGEHTLVSSPVLPNVTPIRLWRPSLAFSEVFSDIPALELFIIQRP